MGTLGFLYCNEACASLAVQTALLKGARGSGSTLLVRRRILQTDVWKIRSQRADVSKPKPAKYKYKLAYHISWRLLQLVPGTCRREGGFRRALLGEIAAQACRC